MGAPSRPAPPSTTTRGSEAFKEPVVHREKAGPGCITNRPELASLAVVHRRHGNTDDASAEPSQLDQHFRLDLVTARGEREPPQGVDPEHAKPALCVLQWHAGEPRQCAAAELIGVIPRWGHALSAELAFAEHEIGAGLRGSAEQLQRFQRKVLHVSVDQEHMRTLSTEQMLESRPDGMSLSSVSGVTDHVSASLVCPFR